MSIILPYFAAFLNMSRIYHITLFFLAPFCILGGIATFRWLFRMLRLHRLQGDHTLLKLVVILVLVPYFLFTTGFVFQLTGATPTSMPLALYKADWPFFASPDIRAYQWIKGTAPSGSAIYGDGHGRIMLIQGQPDIRPSGFPLEIE